LKNFSSRVEQYLRYFSFKYDSSIPSAGKIKPKGCETVKSISVWELAFELFRFGVINQRVLSKKLGVGRATVYRWLKGIRYLRFRRFVNHTSKV